MEKALFADSVATSIGALWNFFNNNMLVKRCINAGGRAGFTSVVVAILFALMIFLSPIAGVVPGAATAPALIIVGVMMASAFGDIEWGDFAEALPVFFTIIFMVVTYSITNGIAMGFIVYILCKCVQRKHKEIHTILWGSGVLFLIYFVMGLQAQVR